MPVYVGLAFLQRGAGILLLPFVTRVMAPEEYGAASTVTMTALLVGVVLGSALEIAVFRWAARAEGHRTDVVLWASQVYIYALLPLMGAAGAVALWCAPGQALGVPMRVWAVEALAQSLTPAATFFALPVLRAGRRLRPIVVITSATVLSMLLAKVVLLAWWPDKLVAWVVADLAAAAAAYTAALVMVRVPRVPVTAAALGELVRFSLPLLPHRISFWALSSLSRPALVIAGGSFVAIGYYSFALNVASVAMMMLAEVNRAVLPEYSRESFPAPSDTTRQVARLQVVAAFAAPAAVGAATAALAPLVVGEAYRAAMPMLGLLLAGQVAYGLYLVPMNYVIQSAGRTAFSWIASLAGAAVIFAGILLLGTDGLQALAAVTSLGFAVMATLAVAICRGLRLEVRWSRLSPGRLAPLSGIALACAIAALMTPPPSSVVLVLTALALLAGLGAAARPLAATLTARSAGPRTDLAEREASR